MKKFLIPIILLIAGLGAGVGAGIVLKPEETQQADANDLSCTCDDTELLLAGTTSEQAEIDYGSGDASNHEFAKLANQFIVPLVNNGVVNGLVVMSITLEVPEGEVENAFSLEPRLRDSFLQVMFDHANTGGFDGNFTTSSNMRVLRRELLNSAKQAAGDKIHDVLILDIVRQDV